MTSPLIRIVNASKVYPTPDKSVFHALKNIDLDIHAGDIVGLIGKSGAGKSSLLRLINLLERPDHGQVIFAGQDLTTLNKKSLRQTRQQIGMIFQQFNLLQNASVFDNVAFPLKIQGGLSTKEIRARVEQCLSIVGLENKKDSYPAQLSGGQKQRVAIARALAPQPQVLLCDEPTSALDAETTREILDTLRDINQRLGVTIVIVSHELAVLSKLCDHVAVIVDGEVAETFALAESTSLRRTALGRELIYHWHEEHAMPLPEGLAHVG